MFSKKFSSIWKVGLSKFKAISQMGWGFPREDYKHQLSVLRVILERVARIRFLSFSVILWVLNKGNNAAKLHLQNGSCTILILIEKCFVVRWVDNLGIKGLRRTQTTKRQLKINSIDWFSSISKLPHKFLFGFSFLFFSQCSPFSSRLSPYFSSSPAIDSCILMRLTWCRVRKKYVVNDVDSSCGT